MLLVGRAIYREGAQIGWAYATGTSVEYYYSDRSDGFVSSMKKPYENITYFGEPRVHRCQSGLEGNDQVP
jgi:hypothetical protein